MGGTPDLLFVIDTNKEEIAIKEATRLGIPVVAIVDTNCDPDGITFPIPGNDDAGRAIALYCDLVARAAIDGISRAQGDLGIDIGAAEAPIVEELPAEEPASGFEALSGPRGTPDDLTKLPGVSKPIEKKLNDARHLPLLADRRVQRRRCRPCRRFGRPAGPGRGLDRQGQGAVGRGRVSRAFRLVVMQRAPVVRPDPRRGGRQRTAAIRPCIQATPRSPGRLITEDDHGHITADGEGPAREDRRGHDGLQDRARARPTATSRPRSTGCARRASPRPPRRPAASPPRAWSASLVEGNKGVVVEVNSETDFVARNEEFQALVKRSPGGAQDRRRRRGHPRRQGRRHTVQEAIASAIATIGENMTLRRAAVLEVGAGRGRRLRPQRDRRDSGLGKIGVIVALESTGDADVLTAFGRKLAMHIAAANPLALDPSGLDPAVIERERAVLTEKTAASGKPAAVIEKIVESGLKTYFKEVCLLDQPYVHDPAKTVAQAVKEIEGKAGAAGRGEGLRALRARRGHREEGRGLRGRGGGRGRRSELGRA